MSYLQTAEKATDKLFVNNQIALPLHITTSRNFTDVGTDGRRVIARTPHPLRSPKMIRNTVCTIFELYKPLFSFVSKCVFISRSQCRFCSYRYQLIGRSPPFTTIWFVGPFLFSKSFWHTHDTKHRYHRWHFTHYSLFKNNYPQQLWRWERCVYPQVYVP